MYTPSDNYTPIFETVKYGKKDTAGELKKWGKISPK